MAINFRGGPPKGPAAKPTDPIQIFQGRPSLESQIGDLWRGQADALTKWYAAKENDILISLNTGAGKSVIGTLICQSWLNAGIQNPVYLCATNDLVEQTAAESSKLALKFSTRIAGDFSNDLFETGKGFLITSYMTLVNARTKLRGELRPGGIVFDDAHVGEPNVRSQYTFTINRRNHPDVYEPVIKLIYSVLTPTDRQKLRFVVDGQGGRTTFLCPPIMGSKLGELLAELSPKCHVDGRPELAFPYDLLSTKWYACAVVVAKDNIELSPPFLPSRVLPSLRDQDVKRVYLSATLKAESEFVRAYGRRPGLIIEPEVDAGNGERSILSAAKLKDSTNVVAWAAATARKAKVLIATPSRASAEVWQSIASPPKREEFAAKLRIFKAAKTGGFLLAGRFDGIDLPDTICRLMIIAGLPSGGSLLENYLWQALEMQNFLAARVATRVTQLFGRIIRGRNDFGLFLIQGKSLTNWLERDRNIALLPDLLQKQIKLGQVLQEDFGLEETKGVAEFFEQVLAREEGWLEYYRGYIDSQSIDERDREQRRKSEATQLESALVEMKFMEALWQGRYPDAVAVVEPKIDEVALSDSKLAGWLNLWTGAALEMDGKAHLAVEHYRIARSRLMLDMELPLDAEDAALGDESYPAASLGALHALAQTGQRIFRRETERVRERIAHAAGTTATTSGSEEAYRALGAFLGFEATRPDLDTGAGPDVLWFDQCSGEALSFELKTGKDENPELSKKDVGQSHNHIQWIADNRPGAKLLRHFIVGKELTVSRFGNPARDWCLSEPMEAISLTEAFVAEASRLRGMGAEQRTGALKTHAESGDWSLRAVGDRLCTRTIVEG